MSYKTDDWLPTFEELKVPELELTSSVLRAGSLYFGKYCDHACKEFMLCNAELDDPRKCLSEGKEVTRCGFEFFGKVKKNCLGEFNQYWKCIDHSGMDMAFKNCRKTQVILDTCMKEKIGLERPPVGYFSKVRVHHTERPKTELKKQILPEPMPDPPDPTTTEVKTKIYPKYYYM